MEVFEEPEYPTVKHIKKLRSNHELDHIGFCDKENDEFEMDAKPCSEEDAFRASA